MLVLSASCWRAFQPAGRSIIIMRPFRLYLITRSATSTCHGTNSRTRLSRPGFTRACASLDIMADPFIHEHFQLGIEEFAATAVRLASLLRDEFSWGSTPHVIQ
jgi:hypothetical protein